MGLALSSLCESGVRNSDNDGDEHGFHNVKTQGALIKGPYYVSIDLTIS